MKKWSLRLLLVVLAVVTCSFIFRSTEDAENDYGSLDQLDPEEMLLYEEAKTMTENYLSMTGMYQEEYTIRDFPVMSRTIRNICRCSSNAITIRS